MAYPPFTFLGRGLGIALNGNDCREGQEGGDLCAAPSMAPNQCMIGFQAALDSHG